MSLSTTHASKSHGGILLPLDMFRITSIAAVMSEVLVSKARNVIGARLILARHPTSQLLLAKIEGSLLGDDAAAFWRENADLALAVSQVIPRQCFLYYVDPGPGAQRREGFVVAQQGQVLTASEATQDSMPAGAKATDWPVGRLCAQLQMQVSDLAEGFPGGPRVDLNLLEPEGDDQAMLMILAGQEPAPAEAAPARAGESSAAGVRPGTGASTTPTIAADLKRRETEQAAERQSLLERAQAVTAGMRHTIDELGLVVAPQAELSEPAILTPFIVTKVAGDLPKGVPTTLTDTLQGKRVDLALRVEFLSEVFVDNVPLTRPVFEQRAETVTLGATPVKMLEVLAPRLGYGTLFRLDKANVFVSRRPGLQVPQALIVELLTT